MSDIQTPAPIIVGYTAGVIKDLEAVMSLPAPPAHFKNDEAIDEWKTNPAKGPRIIQEALNQAAYCKITGRITGLYAVAVEKRSVFNSLDYRQHDLAAGFANWVLTMYPHAFPTYARSATTRRGVAFYGFDTKQFVRVLGTQCNLEEYPVPVGLWYQNDDTFDPYHMLIDADRRKLVSLPCLCAAVGISVPANYRPHVDPEVDAQITMELVHTFELMPAEQVDGLPSLNVKHPTAAVETPAAGESSEEDAAATDEDEEVVEDEAGSEEAEYEEYEDEDEDEYEDAEEDEVVEESLDPDETPA